MALFGTLGKYRNTGLLILRVGLGIMMMTHGIPKLTGGMKMWEGVGSAMGNIGITFFPVFWGLAAAVVETFGGFLFVLGLAFRPACLFLAFVMLTASINHFAGGDGLGGASHAIELGFVFLGLMFVGPGKYSVDKK